MRFIDTLKHHARLGNIALTSSHLTKYDATKLHDVKRRRQGSMTQLAYKRKCPNELQGMEAGQNIAVKSSNARMNCKAWKLGKT